MIFDPFELFFTVFVPAQPFLFLNIFFCICSSESLSFFSSVTVVFIRFVHAIIIMSYQSYYR